MLQIESRITFVAYVRTHTVIAAANERLSDCELQRALHFLIACNADSARLQVHRRGVTPVPDGTEHLLLPLREPDSDGRDVARRSSAPHIRRGTPASNHLQNSTD